MISDDEADSIKHWSVVWFRSHDKDGRFVATDQGDLIEDKSLIASRLMLVHKK